MKTDAHKLATANDTRSRLAQALTDAMENASASCADFRRVTVPVGSLDPLSWLAGQSSKSRFYWGSRDGAAASAGIGIAHEIVSNGAHDGIVDRVADSIAKADAGIRYVGGMRFDHADDSDGIWTRFNDAHFVLPRFEVNQNASETTMTCNLRADDQLVDLLDQLDAVIFDVLPDSAALPAPANRKDTPDRDAWTAMVQQAMSSFEDGEMEKIVLARRVDLDFDVGLDPVKLLLRLRYVTPQCYHFCFQPGNDGAFIGASPERLYFRHGRRIESEAVAGTRPRGTTPDTDAQLSEALLTSDKDLREHAYVRDMIQESLNPLCRDIAVDSRVSLLKLSRRQHLYTGMSGHLSEAVSDAMLCRELHPTPAVGGCPTDTAVQRIRDWEGFDRGWYAAPFGVIGRDVVELAVAIRSACVKEKRLSLFSGAGIVSGSTPDQEWDEIENKIVDFIRILTASV
jgi:menaquinone-specific isochorismate synthase